MSEGAQVSEPSVNKHSLLDLRVAEILDEVAAGTPAPGGGAVAALTTALAAGLVSMCARFADAAEVSAGRVKAADEIAERAEELRRAAAQLADEDAAAYSRYLEARRLAAATATPRNQETVERALSEASAVPLLLAELAAEVAGLAVRVGAGGRRSLRGDATTAALLAAAAASAAALLVAENLAHSAGDPRVARAAALADAARAHAARASGPH